ncbi:hypothetical protein ABIA33_004123 [Streptacidiphilus sp. MAP12-16]|uniref:DUF5324 family protein n=1 Tax=Streptacidiphilus sp. MAP12-16 TaxID=3156300 RepID=UPI003515CB07
MTRIDAAREAAGKTREQIAPYAVGARDAAAHYTDEAWQRLAPRIESAVEQARQAAQIAQSTVDSRVTPRVVPLWEQARANVPPSVEDAVGKAAVRTRSAAKAAKQSAQAAAAQARETAVPAVSHALDGAVLVTTQAAHTARDRGAAAVPVLLGQVTLADIEALTARRARSRRSRWTRRVLVVGTLGVVAGGGLAAWKWWQKQSNPDWLVEPPATDLPPRSTPASASAGEAAANGSSASAAAPIPQVDGSLPLDPEVEAKEAEDKKRPNKR